MTTLLRVLCGLAIFIGIVAFLAGLVFGVASEEPKKPRTQIEREKEIARALMLGGAATVASGFVGLYLIDHKRPTT